MNIFGFILEKLNDEKDVFVGNFVFQFHHNGFVMNKIDEQYLKVETVEYVPVAELSTQETPYVESNNKSDFTKVYGFMLKIPNGEVFSEDDEAYQAMLSLKSTLNGKTFEIDERLCAFKVTVPQFRANIAYAGAWWVLFEIQVTFTVMDHGYFGNDVLIKIKKDGSAQYHTLDFIEFMPATGSDEEPYVEVDTNANGKTFLSRYVTSFTIVFNLYGGDVEMELYKAQIGKGDPQQVYDIRIEHPMFEAGFDYRMKVVGGGSMVKLGKTETVSVELKEV